MLSVLCIRRANANPRVNTRIANTKAPAPETYVAKTRETPNQIAVSQTDGHAPITGCSLSKKIALLSHQVAQGTQVEVQIFVFQAEDPL